MSEFSAFLQLGFDHILDPKGYDHMLFLLTLCAPFLWKDWKKVLILVTAFTLGHSITLALTALDLLSFSPTLIETAIPITIILTAIHNVWGKTNVSVRSSYFIAGLFGLVHGMGFANYFRALLGEAGNITKALFSFNLGIEVGQVLFVIAYLLLSYVFIHMLKVDRREWMIFLSGGGAAVGLTILLTS